MVQYLFKSFTYSNFDSGNRSKEPRVVIVTSGGMLVQKLNVRDWQLEKEKKFDGTMAYAQNKRQQVHLFVDQIFLCLNLEVNSFRIWYPLIC